MSARRNAALFLTAVVALTTAAFTNSNTAGVATTRFVVAPTGNEVRYRVREQLARVDLPNNAIGKTSAIQGGMTVAANSQIVSDESKFTIDAATLTSDRSMRDNYVRRRTLETDTYPMISFVPTSFRGLPNPLPATGSAEFQIVGNLIVKGVTKPVTWNVKATLNGGAISGTATTGFTFADFALNQPQVPIVLSVADSIALEYDFSLIQQKN